MGYIFIKAIEDLTERLGKDMVHIKGYLIFNRTNGNLENCKL